jgi:hypothetical protein
LAELDVFSIQSLVLVLLLLLATAHAVNGQQRKPELSVIPLLITNRATLSISTEMVNAGSVPVKGVLRGRVVGTEVQF